MARGPDHPRRSPRHPGYDHAQPAACFVTICPQRREPLLSEVVGATIRPTPAGQAVECAWLALPQRFPTVALDAFVLMPPHLHAVLFLGASPAASPDEASPSLPTVVRAFKSLSALAANRILGEAARNPFWQRSSHERVVRDDRELWAIRQYILDNPARWLADPDNELDR